MENTNSKIGREKYKVFQQYKRLVLDNEVQYSRVVLDKSSFDKNIGFMDIILSDNYEDVTVQHFALCNNCFHSVLCTGKKLLQQASWDEEVKTNDFWITIKNNRLDKVDNKYIDIVANLVNKQIGEKDICVVESKFEYPDIFKGRKNESRILIFVKGIGLIYSETTTEDKMMDKYVLKDYNIIEESERWMPVETEGNYWDYEITYGVGPTVLNIAE